MPRALSLAAGLTEASAASELRSCVSCSDGTRRDSSKSNCTRISCKAACLCECAASSLTHYAYIEILCFTHSCTPMQKFCEIGEVQFRVGHMMPAF